MDVRCENFRIDEKGGLRGWCDLVIEPLGIRLYSCKLFRGADGDWIEFPRRQFDFKGKKQFARVVEFTTRSAYESFESAALGAIRKFRRESNPPAAPLSSGAAE